MTAMKGTRQVQVYQVGSHALTAYAIAKLCGASRSTFARRITKDGFTVRQAVNSLGNISYEKLLERLS